MNGPADAIAPNATVSVRADEQNLIDVTDLPAGDYVLELEVDPDGAFDDNAANNVASVRIPLVDMQCGGVVCGGVCCPADACEDDGVCHLPDLSVDTEVLEATEDITEHFVGTESCEMIEGCVGGTGNRRLLRFSTTTPNTGTEDLVMGRPEQNPQLFSYSDCHEHYHFDQYADYRLLAEDGTVAATGHKQAFCLIDLERRDDDANLFGTYDCRDQGISKGWADTYSSELDCQWIDITGVAAGNYVLEVHVNPQRIFPEMDHTNNIARVPVSITDDPNFCAPSDEICGNGEDEDCDGEADNGCAPITDNDTCGNAPNAEGSALYTGAITAANDGNVTPSCGGAGGDLFFEFNVPSPEILYLSTYGSEIDTTLSIFRNNACLPEDETDCVDDGCGASGAGGGHIVRSFESGPYTAVVKAKNAGDTGVVRLKIQQAGCNGALPLDGQVEGSTSDSVDNTAPVCAQPHQNGSPAGDGPDEQWYFTTCPGEHPATISTCDGVTQFDSLVELREGSCLGAPLDCNDDLPDGQGGCSTIEPSLRADGAGDGLWFVVVDGYGQNSEGPYSLSLDLQ